MARYLSRSMSSPTVLRASHSLVANLDPNNDHVRFKRGRFVVNEGHEMGQRYVRFNVHELGRLAAEAVGSRSCASISKYPDGMYNKAFLLTMDNGVQVFAKLPTPKAGLPHLTTASEVATMDFLRNILSTPVPKVFAWSSKAQENSVGAEYIIMEKLPGVPLDSVWSQLDLNDRIALAESIAGYQKKWMSLSFQKFGSLYYADDLDGRTQSPLYVKCGGVPITNPRFAVGPSVGRVFMDDGRSTVEFDRGPWNTVEEYHEAIGHQQIACVQSLARLPKSPLILAGPGTYLPTRDKKRKALQSYLAMVKYLLPTDQSMQYPCLWHPDLHLEDIFVNPENLTNVVGITDWQAVEVAPLFHQVRRPYFLDYEGPPSINLERLRPPDDPAQLDPEAKDLHLQMELSAAYQTLVHDQNPSLYRVMDFLETSSFELLLLARNLLVDGEALYLAQVVDLEETWLELPGVKEGGDAPFPFDFSDEEKAEIAADARSAMCGMDLVQAVKERIIEHFPKRQIVQNGQGEESYDALRQMKEKVIGAYADDGNSKQAWQDSWPFGN